jgi:hypothetical protein
MEPTQDALIARKLRLARGKAEKRVITRILNVALMDHGFLGGNVGEEGAGGLCVFQFLCILLAWPGAWKRAWRTDNCRGRFQST